MTKSELEIGMEVRNRITGSIGVILGDEDGSLGYAEWCVGIRRRIASGKNKGRYKYTVWSVKNLETVSQE